MAGDRLPRDHRPLFLFHLDFQFVNSFDPCIPVREISRYGAAREHMQRGAFVKPLAIFVTASLALAGCAVNPQPAFQQVDATVYDRTNVHVRWNTSAADDSAVQAAVGKRLMNALTPDSAVEIALLNNPSLQATFEEIGIAQSDLVQAGLLRNPEFAASWRFPDRAPRQTDAEYSVSGNFLELLILPLRIKVAAAELARTQNRVADAVVSLVAQVKIAYYTLQSQEELLERLRVINDANDTAAELAGRQHAAGTINDLELSTQKSIAGESALEVMKATIDLTTARETLARLLGLDEASACKVDGKIAEPPPSDATPNQIEAFALNHRLDLAASRQSVAALAQSLGLTEDFRYLGTLRIGADTEHNPDAQDVTGPTLDLELPLFDQGQPRIEALQSEYRQARRRLQQQVLEVRSEVRMAQTRMTAERGMVMLCEQTLLPQRTDLLNTTTLHYDAMLKGPYDLLIARQNELAAERAGIEARRDYWIARAELERAVGGRLPPTPTPQAAPPTGDK
jgi:cobalt-zinc-cadmium efflux system outer membrane protein